MKPFDVVLSIVVIFLVAKNIMATVNNSKVKLKGAVSGQFIGNIILTVAVCGLILLKPSQFTYPWLYPIGMALYVASAFLVKSGFGEAGLYYNGKRVPYSEMEFYVIEQMGDKRFFLRMHGYNKEYIITYPTEQREVIETVMKNAKVKVAERIDPRAKDENK
jgi:hypothetical protein